MKKAIAALGIGTVSLVMSCLDASALESAIVTADALNMRSGPGINYSKRGVLHKGTKVTIIEKTKGWVKIETSSGKKAWVSGQYLSNSEDNSSSSSNQSGYIAYVSVSTSLNVRSSASTSSSVIDSLKNNERVQVLEKNGSGWTKVKINNGKIGWVSSQYLVSSPNNQGNTSTQNNSEVSSGRVKVTASSGLNVRKGPGTNYGIVGSLAGGSVVQVKEKSGGWIKVVLPNGSTGWISGQYTSSTSTNESVSDGDSSQSSKPSQNDSSNASGRVKVTISKGLNIRKGPGTNNSVIGSLAGGSVVQVKEKSNGWYKIKTANGIEGWISGDYVTPTNEPLSGGASSNSSSSGNNSSSNNGGGSYGNGETSASGEKIVEYAKNLLGVPYKWGGDGPSNFDCSGYTRWVYRNAAGINIPRVSREQAQAGTSVEKGNYKKGDLLYFNTGGEGVSHVGIYIGGDQFIHCSGTKAKPGEVKISSLSGYYGNVLLGARRFV